MDDSEKSCIWLAAASQWGAVDPNFGTHPFCHCAMKHSIRLILILLLFVAPRTGGDFANGVGDPSKKVTITIPILVKENEILVLFSGAQLSDKVAPPPGKCWKWLDPCPEKGAKVVPREVAWTISGRPLAIDGEKEGKGKVYVLGPTTGKVRFDKRGKEGWKLSVRDSREVTIAGKTNRLWTLELGGLLDAAEIIPIDPPESTGCWKLVDCDPESE